jgi:sensor histidine kinase YesM
MIEAKIFFVEKSLSINQSLGYFIGPAGQRNYPLNISLFSSWIYSVLGTWDDLLVKIIFPTFLLAMTVIFYYSMRRIANRAASLFSTYLLLTLPFLIYHSSTSYIDAVVGFYFFSSFAFLLLFIRTGKLSYLVLSALLAGICTWTKNEGIFLIVNNLFVLLYFLIFKDKENNTVKFKNAIKYFVCILFFLAPWSLFRFVFREHIPVPEEIPNLFHLFDYADRIPIMLDFYYRKMFFYGNYNIAWFVLIIVTVIAIIRKRIFLENMIVLFSVFFGMSAFGSVYCFSKNCWPYLLDGTIQDRNFLTFISLVVFYSCISIFRKNDNILGGSK